MRYGKKLPSCKLTFRGTVTLIGLLAVASPSAATTSMAIEPTADSFVRIMATTRTFGSAGALCIGGTQCVNSAGSARGRFDTMMKFSTLPCKTHFDQTYGPGNWFITHVNLRLSEDPSPNNITFPIGAGTFEVFWFSNDNWLESTGTPNSPHTGAGTDLTWSYLTAMAASAQQQSLGQFESAGTAATQFFSLTPSAGLLSELNAGSVISLRFSAVSTRIGFVFYSKDHVQGMDEHPLLEIVAEPIVPLSPRGDMNCDGQLNNFDIDPFSLAIVDINQYQLTYPNCNPLNGDINHDGLVNNFDIDPFVTCIVSGCP